MNRARAVRYGNQASNIVEEGLPMLSKSARIEQSNHKRNYNSFNDPLLHQFGSHQILVSCLQCSQNSLSTVASRDIPLTVVHSILSFLDSKSVASVKILSKKGPISFFEVIRECCRSQQPQSVKKFGTNARLAMMVLSERLFTKANKVTTSGAADIIDLEKFEVGSPFCSEGESKSETKPILVLNEINESSDGNTRTIFGNFRAIIQVTIFFSIFLLVLFLLKSWLAMSWTTVSSQIDVGSSLLKRAMLYDE